jgi:hypothetical protein
MEIHPQKVQGIEANVNTRKKNQNNKKINNEVEDIMLKGYPLPQIS